MLRATGHIHMDKNTCPVLSWDNPLSVQAYQRYATYNPEFNHIRAAIISYVKEKRWRDFSTVRFIDFGAGSGEFLRQAVVSGSGTCIGIDKFPKMIKEAETLGEMDDAYQKIIGETFNGVYAINYLQMDCFLPEVFRDWKASEKGDVVTCIHVHYAKTKAELATWVKNMFDVLKPNGTAFIFCCGLYDLSLEDMAIRYKVFGQMPVDLEAMQLQDEPMDVLGTFFEPDQVNGGFTDKPCVSVDPGRYLWKKATVKHIMMNVGFTNVHSPTFSYFKTMAVGFRSAMESLDYYIGTKPAEA